MQLPFPEVFLHHIWKFKLFDVQNLQTTNYSDLELVQIGTHNHHAGPDFSNARIRIGATLWAGSVEIHKKSSDWLLHQHQHDAAYNNTILHVVYEHDQEIYRHNGELIPTLELKNKIPKEYIQRYWTLLNSNQTWIPCEGQLSELLDLQSRMSMWLDRLVVERLEQKVQVIEQELALNSNNWEEIFYRFLARSFGVKENVEPFEALAKSLPLKVLSKHKQNLMQLEALLLGQAGFLEDELEDDYTKALQKEYLFLKQKYQLTTLQAASWKFGRMRPANFPTIRLAQFALLVHQSSHLFSKILEEIDVKSLKALFEIKLTGYWKNHYRLDEISTLRNKTLGKSMIDLLLINTVAPFLFVYGRLHGQEIYKDRALQLLESIQAEQNSITSNWQELGLVSKTAYDSQGFIQLKKEYCDQKRCLDCVIGHKILQNDKKNSIKIIGE